MTLRNTLTDTLLFCGFTSIRCNAEKALPIVPGEARPVSFVAERAGTFIYFFARLAHPKQVDGGSSGQLYGALVVLEPGQKWNDTTDHVFIVSQGGPGDDAIMALNGRPGMPPLELKAGVTHRFRFINIAAGDQADVSIRGDSSVVAWRLVAKDGAALPPGQVALRPARFHFGAGETFDVEFTPKAGTYLLEVLSYSNILLTLRFK